MLVIVDASIRASLVFFAQMPSDPPRYVVHAPLPPARNGALVGAVYIIGNHWLPPVPKSPQFGFGLVMQVDTQVDDREGVRTIDL
jgi:hypothetical protein